MRHARSARDKAAADLSQEWMKSLFVDFTEHAHLQQQPGNVFTLIKRNIEGFRKIDTSIDSPATLTVSSVLQAFSADESNRRYSVIKSYLSLRYELDFHGPEAKQFHHDQKLQRVYDSAAADWIRAELHIFHEKLMSDRRRRLNAGIRRCAVPMQLSSILLAMKYASWFMSECAELGAESTLSITQEMLDDYTTGHQRTFHALGAFVRHLNKDRSRFVPLELAPRRSSRSSIHLRLPAQKRAQVVDAWLKASGSSDLRNASVALICMFYLQKPTKVLSLRREHLKHEDGHTYIEFGYGWEVIDPQIAAVLNRWLENWFIPTRFKEIASSDFIFPGARAGHAHSAGGFSQWLRKKHGINKRQLFGTALHGLIEAGLNDPGAMVYQFGVRLGTAIRYWKDSGRNLGSFFYADALDEMRANGDFDIA